MRFPWFVLGVFVGIDGTLTWATLAWPTTPTAATKEIGIAVPPPLVEAPVELLTEKSVEKLIACETPGQPNRGFIWKCALAYDGTACFVSYNDVKAHDTLACMWQPIKRAK